MSIYDDLISDMWDQHTVFLEGQSVRTAFGTTYSPPQEIQASVKVQNRVVTTQTGEDVTVSATVRWHPTGPMPKTGALITLPEQFGLDSKREIVTVQHISTGTGLTPGRVEVTLK